MKKHQPVSPLPNEKIVISDKKMADHIGISIQDFRRNIKPIWRVLGIMAWSSALVQLNIPKQQVKYCEFGKNVFIHKGYAYTHTTQYHLFSEI